MVRIDERVRSHDGVSIQAAPIVRSFGHVRSRGIRKIRMSKPWDTCGSVIAACASSIESGDLVANVFRRNEVVQVGIRSLIEDRSNLVAARDRLTSRYRSRAKVSIERAHIGAIGHRVLHQDDVDVRAAIRGGHEDDTIGNRIHGSIGRAGLANVFSQVRAAVNIPIMPEHLPYVPA